MHSALKIAPSFFHDNINLLVSQGRLECWPEELGRASLYRFDVTGPTIGILSITTVLLFFMRIYSTYVFEAVKVAQVRGLL